MDAVSLFLARGLTVDRIDAFGFTPLHRAIEAGSLQVAQRLKEAGANPRTPTQNQRHNALTLAAQAGALDIVEWLVAACGLAPGATPPDGQPPLLVSLFYRQYAVSEHLIRAGADLSVTDPKRGLSIASLYTRQIREAQTYGLVDQRHRGLENVLKESGFPLALRPIPKPKPQQTKEQSTSTSPKSRGSQAQYLEDSKRSAVPGATAFFAEFMPQSASGVWNTVVSDEKHKILDQVSPVDGKWSLDMDTAQVSWRMLPFYERVAIISIQSEELDQRKIRFFYLTSDDNLYRLNGTSPPIHEMNAKAPLKLNENNVLDYLRFFCFFVRGEEGPFYVAEDIRDPILPRFEDQTARTVLANTVRPAIFKGMSEDGFFLCDAVLSYSNALFIADFSVKPTGMLQMLGDEPIAADLPGRVSWRLS